MSFPLFVLPFWEIPKANLIPAGLLTILDTSQGPLYIGKHCFVLILCKNGQNFSKILVKQIAQ